MKPILASFGFHRYLLRVVVDLLFEMVSVIPMYVPCWVFEHSVGVTMALYSTPS